MRSAISETILPRILPMRQEMSGYRRLPARGRAVYESERYDLVQAMEIVRKLPKLDVAGSNPVGRSKNSEGLRGDP